MINDVQYIKLEEIASRITRHPLMKDANLEAIIQYTIDFIGLFGLPQMYEDKEVIVPISCYRGQLPCDLIRINQVMDPCTNMCLRSTTDTFYADGFNDGNKSVFFRGSDELTYKIKNFVIFTSFPEGELKVSYKAIPVDEDDQPLIIDNSKYLRALEAYIKMQLFTILFDTDKIKAPVLQNAQQQYAFAAGALNSEFSIPSVDEMESIKNSWTTLVELTRQHQRGFRHLGDQQYIRQH